MQERMTTTAQPTSYSHLPHSETGLQLFANLDNLYIKKEVVGTDDMTAFCSGKQNRFQIMNSSERDVCSAYEDPSLCCPQVLCGRARPSDVVLTAGPEVVRYTRSLTCPSYCCCFPCCLQHIKVYSPGGSLLGTVSQEWSLCAPSFLLSDSMGQPTLRVYREAWCHWCRFGEGE